MQTQLDIYLSFPLPKWQEEDFEQLFKYCGAVEQIEEDFDIEFSCGDDLYLSDIQDDDALLDRYDGEVSTDYPPRDRETGEKLSAKKQHRFTIKYSEKSEEAIFYLNRKEISRRWVG